MPCWLPLVAVVDVARQLARRRRNRLSEHRWKSVVARGDRSKFDRLFWRLLGELNFGQPRREVSWIKVGAGGACLPRGHSRLRDLDRVLAGDGLPTTLSIADAAQAVQAEPIKCVPHLRQPLSPILGRRKPQPGWLPSFADYQALSTPTQRQIFQDADAFGSPVSAHRSSAWAQTPSLPPRSIATRAA